MDLEVILPEQSVVAQYLFWYGKSAYSSLKRFFENKGCCKTFEYRKLQESGFIDQGWKT